MKIAFPVIDENGLEANMAGHFGRAPYFTVYDEETKNVNVISNQGDHFGGKLAVPTFLKNNGVHALICLGLGRKAITMFDQYGIQVFITSCTNVNDALKSYQNGELNNASEADGCAGSKHHH